MSLLQPARSGTLPPNRRLSNTPMRAPWSTCSRFEECRSHRRVGKGALRLAHPARRGTALGLILRSALLRASRRMATGTAERAAILRDAPQRCGAPQDEV